MKIQHWSSTSRMKWRNWRKNEIDYVSEKFNYQAKAQNTFSSHLKHSTFSHIMQNNKSPQKHTGACKHPLSRNSLNFHATSSRINRQKPKVRFSIIGDWITRSKSVAEEEREGRQTFELSVKKKNFAKAGNLFTLWKYLLRRVKGTTEWYSAQKWNDRRERKRKERERSLRASRGWVSLGRAQFWW